MQMSDNFLFANTKTEREWTSLLYKSNLYFLINCRKYATVTVLGIIKVHTKDFSPNFLFANTKAHSGENLNSCKYWTIKFLQIRRHSCTQWRKGKPMQMSDNFCVAQWRKVKPMQTNNFLFANTKTVCKSAWPCIFWRGRHLQLRSSLVQPAINIH